MSTPDDAAGTAASADRAALSARQPPGASRRRRRRIAFNFVLLGGIVAAIIAWIDVAGVLRLIVAVPPAAVGIAFGLATLDRVLMGLKWRHLIGAAGERIAARDAVSAYYQSGFASRVLPIGAAQDVLRGYLLNRKGVPAGVLLGSVTIEKLVALLAAVVIAAAGATYLLAELEADARTALAIAVAAGFTAALAGIALALSRPVHRLGRTWLLARLPARLGRTLGQGSESLLLYRGRPRVLAENLGLAVLEHFTQMTKFYVLGRAMGIHLPVLTFFATIAVVMFARRATGYFEGWGLAEAASVLTFSLLGVGSERAVALAATNYAITTLATLPGGYLLYRGKLGLGRWLRGSE